MSVAASLMFALLANGASSETQVGYVDASLDLRGELLDWRFVDIDLDGKRELCLALRVKAGRRELHLHRTSKVRVEAEPYKKIHILPDVLAYGFANVREDPGQELLLFTRSGVHSYSPELPGYRDNARKLVLADLIYDVPDPSGLPYWEYVMPSPRGDFVVVPVHGGLEVWGPPGGVDAPAGGDSDYRRISRLGTDQRGFVKPGDRQTISRRSAQRSPDNISVRVDIDREFGPFFPGALPGAGAQRSKTLLSNGRSIPAPAMLDVDGNGRLDLLIWQSIGSGADHPTPKLAIYLNDGSGFPSTPSRVEELPDYLSRDGYDLSMELVDLDGDGDRDLIAKLEEDPDSFENSEILLFMLVNDGKKFFPPKPNQLMRFEAGVVIAKVVDVDGNGRPDLFLREFELPSLLGAVTGLEFKLNYLLYTSETKGGRLFERTPSLKQEHTFDENNVIEAVASRDISLDCDGDCVPDLVEVDIHGNVAIRRLQLEKGFFGGRSWELEDNPWKRFEINGSITSLEVSDLNGDGLGDIVSQTDDMLRILLSSRRGR